MRYKGIIFDLDGVLCSTDQYHYKAWKQLADSIDVPFDSKKNNRLRGVSRMESLNIILEDTSRIYTDEEKQKLAAMKNEIYRALLETMTPRNLSQEVRSTLKRLKGWGIRLAIGSSSKNTPLILQRIGLAGWFDAVSDGNNIINAKPDPEVFLKAAAMLGLNPKDCLVVEDALAGAEAGHRGGFDVACVGDAARRCGGEYNLDSFQELCGIMAGK